MISRKFHTINIMTTLDDRPVVLAPRGKYKEKVDAMREIEEYKDRGHYVRLKTKKGFWVVYSAHKSVNNNYDAMLPYTIEKIRDS